MKTNKTVRFTVMVDLTDLSDYLVGRSISRDGHLHAKVWVDLHVAEANTSEARSMRAVARRTKTRQFVTVNLDVPRKGKRGRKK